jgi:hypothetical protein
MNWYLAKLVFQLRSAENTQTPQFEEQWRLIRADDDEWAHEKATTLYPVWQMAKGYFLQQNNQQMPMHTSP